MFRKYKAIRLHVLKVDSFGANYRCYERISESSGEETTVCVDVFGVDDLSFHRWLDLLGFLHVGLFQSYETNGMLQCSYLKLKAFAHLRKFIYRCVYA